MSVRPRNRAWWASFLILFAMAALWSLASPLFSVADEPAHVVRAAAVARGQLGGRDRTEFVDRQVRTEVLVPRLYAIAGPLPECYIGRTDVSAACAPAFEGPTDLVPVLTQVGRYPPAYYLVVGLPSRWFPSGTGVHLMRLVSAAVAAALLASAFVSLRHIEGGASVLLGLILAVTPMVVFLAGSVNPSGVEIAAAIGLWIALTGLLLGHRDGTSVGFATRAALAGSVLLLTRPLGPLMATLIIGVACVAAGRQRLRTLAGRSEVRRAAVAFGIVGVAAVAWILARDTLSGIGGTPIAEPMSTGAVVARSLSYTTRNVLQMVGSFGFTDTPAPALTYILWFACLGFLTVVAFAKAGRREAAALVLLLGVIVAVPVALESSHARLIGFAWLGRYTLPLAVGLPILGAHVAGDMLSTVGRRLAALFAAAAGAAHLLAFVWALRRYTGGLRIGRSHPWAPPGTAPALIVAFATVGAVYAWWLWRLTDTRPEAVASSADSG